MRNAYLCKVNEIILVHDMEAYGGVDVQLHSFLTLALDAVKSSIPLPPCFMHREIVHTAQNCVYYNTQSKPVHSTHRHKLQVNH